jgi:hypothetical protein
LNADSAAARPEPFEWRDPALRAIPLVAVLTAVVELLMGRTFLGPDGRFGLWEGDIRSAANSQRFADPYSFTHVGHGLVFYFLLWAAARRLAPSRRLLVAVVIEAAWEILENSPIIVERYREATIAQGYAGDSVLNSLSDLLMMSLGFLLAWRLRPWQGAALLLAMELVLLVWVRDNLTLNVLMLLHPFDSIKAWQMSGAP